MRKWWREGVGVIVRSVAATLSTPFSIGAPVQCWRGFQSIQRGCLRTFLAHPVPLPL